MKTVFKAYVMAFIGLLFGIIGLHRFYLEMNATGALMLLLFVAGIASFAIGYAHMLSPLLQYLGAGNIDFTQLPSDGLINNDSKNWFVVGGLSCVASLCWLCVDLILMSSLTARANNR